MQVCVLKHKLGGCEQTLQSTFEQSIALAISFLEWRRKAAYIIDGIGSMLTLLKNDLVSLSSFSVACSDEELKADFIESKIPLISLLYVRVISREGGMYGKYCTEARGCVAPRGLSAIFAIHPELT